MPRPDEVPYNDYYHGNRWDPYSPPKATCPKGHSGNVHVHSPPYRHDPRWHFKCYACDPYGRHFTVDA